MNVIYERFKRAILEGELSRMERYSNEKLEKIVEEAKHSVGVAGEAAEHSRLVAEGFGKAARKTAFGGLDISHYAPAFGGLITIDDPHTPGFEADAADAIWSSAAPLMSDSIWVALYGGGRKPRFKFAASPEDLDLDFEDFEMDVQQFSIAFDLMVSWDPHKPLENYIKCPITNQKINLDHFRIRGLLLS